jgi:hypothetical protein
MANLSTKLAKLGGDDPSKSISSSGAKIAQR